MELWLPGRVEGAARTGQNAVIARLHYYCDLFSTPLRSNSGKYAQVGCLMTTCLFLLTELQAQGSYVNVTQNRH
jgi:hypothetical protein